MNINAMCRRTYLHYIMKSMDAEVIFAVRPNRFYLGWVSSKPLRIKLSIVISNQIRQPKS